MRCTQLVLTIVPPIFDAVAVEGCYAASETPRASSHILLRGAMPGQVPLPPWEGRHPRGAPGGHRAALFSGLHAPRSVLPPGPAVAPAQEGEDARVPPPRPCPALAGARVRRHDLLASGARADEARRAGRLVGALPHRRCVPGRQRSWGPGAPGRGSPSSPAPAAGPLGYRARAYPQAPPLTIGARAGGERET
jgi:hypothetical protein